MNFPNPENVHVPDRNFTINIKNSKSLHVNVNQLNFFYDCTLDNYYHKTCKIFEVHDLVCGFDCK